VNELELELQLC